MILCSQLKEIVTEMEEVMETINWQIGVVYQVSWTLEQSYTRKRHYFLPYPGCPNEWEERATVGWGFLLFVGREGESIKFCSGEKRLVQTETGLAIDGYEVFLLPEQNIRSVKPWAFEEVVKRLNEIKHIDLGGYPH